MIGIVGAGLTGLVLGNALDDLGIDHVILEASDRVGGVIRSSLKGGLVLESGPQRMRLVGPVDRLVERLGLRDELVLAPKDLPILIYAGGELHEVPRDLTGLARSRLLSPAAKLRILMEPFAGAPRFAETAGAYLRRRFGREPYTTLLAPLFGGLYASDPDSMLARHALAPLLRTFGIERSVIPVLLKATLRARRESDRMPAACSFRGGLATLTKALHDRVSRHVRVGTPVRAASESRDGTWVLHTDTGDMEVESIVLTCPADVAGRLIAGVDPAAAERLARLTYNHIALVHLAGDPSRRAAGYQVAFDEPIRTRGVTFHHALFGRAGLNTAFLGGRGDVAVTEDTDDQLAQTATQEFERVTGSTCDVIAVERTRIPAWDSTWAALDDLRLPAGLHICANYESRVGIPGRIVAAERLARKLALQHQGS